MDLLRELLTTPSPSDDEDAVRAIVRRELNNYGAPHAVDDEGNVWAIVGNPGDSPTLFTAHMDSVHNDKPVVLYERGDIIRLDPFCEQRALGADDKVGVRLLLHLIEHGVKGTYIFTVAEEVGCCGARHAADLVKPWNNGGYIQHAVCFDRRDVHSVITKMGGTPCCSDEYATKLIRMLNESHKDLIFFPDPTGSTTDTKQFAEAVKNYTNISAGYYDEHSTSEMLDVAHVRTLMEVVHTLDWDSLAACEVRPQPKPVTPYTPPVNRTPTAGCYDPNAASFCRKCGKTFDAEAGYYDGSGRGFCSQKCRDGLLASEKAAREAVINSGPSLPTKKIAPYKATVDIEAAGVIKAIQDAETVSDAAYGVLECLGVPRYRVDIEDVLEIVDLMLQKHEVETEDMQMLLDTYKELYEITEDAHEA